MDKKLVTNLFKLKLEVIGAMAELLPEPVKTKTINCQRELLQVVHQVTGEYLAEEQAAAAKQGAPQKVEIL